MADLPAPTPDAEPELLRAVDRAARHVRPVEGDGSRGVIRYDDTSTSSRRTRVLATTLAIVSLGTALLVLLGSPDLSPIEQERDLRWAVAQVVQRVEILRERNGVLPDARELRGLLSEFVVYEHDPKGYRVVGQRGDARVEYDGSLPVQVWLQGTGVDDPGVR